MIIDDEAFRVWIPDTNPPELYKWALGYVLKMWRLQEGISQTKAAEILGVSQGGYWKLEQGDSPNLDLWMKAFSMVEKDFVSAGALARVVVRAVQAEQQAQNKELSKDEKIAIADELVGALNT